MPDNYLTRAVMFFPEGDMGIIWKGNVQTSENAVQIQIRTPMITFLCLNFFVKKAFGLGSTSRLPIQIESNGSASIIGKRGLNFKIDKMTTYISEYQCRI